MFGTRLILTGVVLLALLLAALGAARPSSGAAPEARYVVRPGDTLWSIAAGRYGGDPRKGVWRIAERNRISGGCSRPARFSSCPEKRSTEKLPVLAEQRPSTERFERGDL